MSSPVSEAYKHLLCLLCASYNLHICGTAMTVMATAVSLDRSIALSVSADHLVGRYDVKVCAFDSHVISGEIQKNGEQINLLQADPISNLEAMGTVFRTKHPGNGAVAFHDDGRVCAIGGWDGRYVPHIIDSAHR